MNIPSIYKRIAISVCVIAGVGFASYSLAISPCLAKIEQVNASIESKKVDVVDIEQLIDQKDKLQSSVSQQKAQIAKFQNDYVGYNAMTSEEMLMYLTQSSKEQGLALVAFYDYGVVSSGQAWSGQYNLEVRGNLNGLRNFIQSLDYLNMRYSVGGVSLMEDVPSIQGVGDYTYRYFDGITSMPWFGSTSQVGRASYDDLTIETSTASNSHANVNTSKPLDTDSTVSDWANAPQHDPNAAFNAATQSYKPKKYDVSLLTNDLVPELEAPIITDTPNGNAGNTGASEGIIVPDLEENNQSENWIQTEEVKEFVPPVFENITVPDTGIYTLDLTLNFMMYKDPELDEFSDTTSIVTNPVS